MGTPLIKTCATCGFLAKVRNRVSSQTQFEPVDPRERLSGIIGTVSPSYLLCVMGRRSGLNLNDEVKKVIDCEKDAQPPIQYKDAVLAVLRQPRETCVEQGVWFEWDEYLTPKEHREEFKMLQLEQIRQEEVKRTQSAQRRDFRVSMAALFVAVFVGLAQVWVAWQEVEISKANSKANNAVVITTPVPSAPDTPNSQMPTISAEYPETAKD